VPSYRQALNFATLVVVLVVNALAGAGALSGESIGVIANRYQSYFLPADYVFGIWSVIYLGLAAFAVYQFRPARRNDPTLERLGLWWVGNGLLNIAWIVAFSFSLFALALAVMALLLVDLIVIHEKIGIGRARLDVGTRAFVALPFSAYLAWISVAIIANAFQLAVYFDWGGFGLGGAAWAVIMLGVGTLLAIAMTALRGNWVFPLVFAWAFFGIARRYPETPAIADGVYIALAVMLVATPVMLVLVRKRGREWV